MPCGSVCVRCALLRCHSKYLAALHLPSPFNSSFPSRVCHAERRSSSCKRLLICACSKAKAEDQQGERERSSKGRRETRERGKVERGSWRQAETLCNFCLFCVLCSLLRPRMMMHHAHYSPKVAALIRGCDLHWGASSYAEKISPPPLPLLLLLLRRVPMPMHDIRL